MGRVDQLLVGVDFSRPSLSALHCAALLADRRSAALTVLHVLPRRVGHEERWVVRDDMFRVIDRGARLLKLLEESPHAAAHKATVRLEIGNPVELLLATTRALKPALLVVGQANDPRTTGDLLAELRASASSAVIGVRPDALE